MTKWSITGIAALALIAVAAIVFAFIAQSNSSAKSMQLADLQAAASSTQEALRAMRATSEAALTVANQANATASAEAIVAATAQAELQVIAHELFSQLTAEETKVASLAASNMCGDSPLSIDYSSNTTVSNSLKAWLEDTKGTIDTARWDVIWNNSRTTIHKLTGKYLFVYIVYFDESDLGKKQAVFDLSNMCWLDR